MKWLLEKGTIVIAAGGGGIPTVYEPGRVLRGIEAVIDKDLCSELLARELEADSSLWPPTPMLYSSIGASQLQGHFVDESPGNARLQIPGGFDGTES